MQAWEFFTDSNLHALIIVVASYYGFNVEFPSRVAVSTCEEIVGVVVRDQILSRN